MKKSILLGLGVCALALGGVAAFAGQKVAAETKATSPAVGDAVTYRLTNKLAWENVYIYAWNTKANTNKNAEFPGVKLTNHYVNEESAWVYTIDMIRYENVIFSKGVNGDSNQTQDLNGLTDSAWWTKTDGRCYGTPYGTEKTIYLYDYDNTLNGTAYCVANNANTTGFTKAYLPMSVSNLAYNGRVYSLTLDVKYSHVSFADNAQGTGASSEVAVNVNNNYALKLDQNVWWDNINYVYAHNWAMNDLKLRTIDHDKEETRIATDDCASNYAVAKASYKKIAGDSNITGEIKKGFKDYLGRFAHWASVNGDSFDADSMILTEGNLGAGLQTAVGMDSSNNSSLAIGMITIGVLASLGGLFLLRKKRAE